MIFTRTSHHAKTLAATMLAATTLAVIIAAAPARAQTDFLGTLTRKVLSAAPQAPGTAGAQLPTADVAGALKDALAAATATAVGKTGKADGFLADPTIRIPLPATLQGAHKALSAVGMGALTQDLELRINRAAEQAAPKARALFLSSIKNMTFADARTILNGPDDAATQYLRKTMGAGLARDMQPVVTAALQDAGAIKAYDSVTGTYSQLPFVAGIKGNLTSYVVERAMDGIFHYVAVEEAAIRKNPAQRTTALMKKVFAATQK